MATQNAASATAKTEQRASSFQELAELLKARNESQQTPEKPEGEGSEATPEGESEQVLSQEEVEQAAATTDETGDESGVEAQESGEASESEDGEDEAGQPDWVKGRISKLSAQKNEWKRKAEEADTKLKELEAKLTEAQTREKEVPVSIPNDTLGFINSREKLAEYHRAVKKQADLLDKFLCEMPLSDENQKELQSLAKSLDAMDGEEFNVPKLKYARQMATNILLEEIPTKHAYFDSEAKMSAEAEADYPWWKNKQSQQYGLVSQALKMMPEIKRFPDWKRFVSHWAEGAVMEMQRKAKASSTGKPAATKPKIAPTKISAAPGSSSPKTAPRPDTTRDARAALEQSGSVRDLASYLKARSGVAA